MIKARLVIGIICIAISVRMFISVELSEDLALAIVILIMGMTLVAISRYKKAIKDNNISFGTR